jgi:hypothetical protein
MYSASELYFTRTVRCFFKENKICIVHLRSLHHAALFTEQCSMVQPQEIGNICFCFLAFQTHNLMGLMNNNLYFLLSNIIAFVF